MARKRLKSPDFLQQDHKGPGGGELAAQVQPQRRTREGALVQVATRNTYSRHPLMGWHP